MRCWSSWQDGEGASPISWGDSLDRALKTSYKPSGSQNHERLRQRPAEPEGALVERRETDLHLLSRRRAAVGALRRQVDAACGEGLPERPAAVGQVPKSRRAVPPPRRALANSSSTRGSSAALAAVNS